MSTNPNNNVSLVGRLTKASQLYTPPKGAAYTFTTLAVNGRKKSNGDRTVQYINCLISGKGAENFVKYTDKGCLVSIKGELEVYVENKDGQKHYNTRVLVTGFDVLSWPAKRQESLYQNAQSMPQPPVPSSEQTSFFQGQSTQFKDDYLPEPPMDWPEDGM